MKLAFAIPNLMQVKVITRPWETRVQGGEMVKLAKWADKLGYEMIAVPEHFVIPRENVELSGAHHVAAYPAMAFFAGATERIRVNSCIALLPLQNPIVTAKNLSTMDWLSGGRVTVTFASGWLKGEYEALGVPFHERGAMADEYIRAIIALWTQEEPEFEGRYVRFRDVAFEPKCHRRPHLQVWFGGGADAVLRRIARHASGWWPAQVAPEDIPARIDYIKSRPDYNGQLQDVFFGFATTRVGKGHVAVDDPAARGGQGKQEIIDRLSWFKELGVTMSSAPSPEIDDVAAYYDYTQWVAEEIMPAIA
ncbi:MAG: TIGR03619 family F420-dependent LLM class oxidoreductase [Novosphingobium sp.]|jgi:probable F420-dependent oxidoreductase|nr:TIGR03619 family F420-dependent LLM class oxidoreductase [Novosphingobium sp.]